MNKLTNGRWSDRMPPLPFRPPPQPQMNGHIPSNGPMNGGMPAGIPHMAMHPQGGPIPGAVSAPTSAHPMPINSAHRSPESISCSFNIPMSSGLAGPNTEDILYASENAILRWTHPKDAPDNIPISALPVHVENLAHLQKLCHDLTQSPLPVKAHAEATIHTYSGRSYQVVTCLLSGPPDLVHKSRETILNGCPIHMTCATVDIDGKLVCDFKSDELTPEVKTMMNDISAFCGVDIFLLGPKLSLLKLKLREGPVDERWRIAIYGDVGSVEHAKVHILLRIDLMLRRTLDLVKLDPTYHQPVSGRHRKNLKVIESMTNTSIYFPPHLLQSNRYHPRNAHRRDPQDVYITGETQEGIDRAKAKLLELTMTRIDSKEVEIDADKLDNILFNRLAKVRKIGDTYGTHIALPMLGTRRKTITVHGSDAAQCERTIREILDLTGQFYHGFWHMRPGAYILPSQEEIDTLLKHITSHSNADIVFDGEIFAINGTDESVKKAIKMIAESPEFSDKPFSAHIKVELAVEHKEFVSGKKNGKLNKIIHMVQKIGLIHILFEGYNDYNFNIEVISHNYKALEAGIGYVEQEMPASISFHVPDQYHKKIIGIGGHHIQSIMRKHSVFVKFSNAMDRGGAREEDDLQVGNVVCRTPARNAQNLEAVKSEILEMVDEADSEYTTQIVEIDRLFQRRLVARLRDIDKMEKKYNCKILFPSTEEASDEVTVIGPQWNVPRCADELLGMVPATHEMIFEKDEALSEFLDSAAFSQTLIESLKNQSFNVTVKYDSEKTDEGNDTICLDLSFTRANAAGLGEVIDQIQYAMTTAGVEVKLISGNLPRPKSNSFEESMNFFDSRLLPRASTVALPTPEKDAPVESEFVQEVTRGRNNLLEKLRKPSIHLVAFLERRKNSSHQVTNPTLFSSSTNVSKTSLISIESTRSFPVVRDPWNDSAVNLDDDASSIFSTGGGLVPPGSSQSSVVNPWAINHNNPNEAKLVPMITHPGDISTRHLPRASADSGRPSTSHSINSGHSMFPHVGVNGSSPPSALNRNGAAARF